jgi:hypothetical protein
MRNVDPWSPLGAELLAFEAERQRALVENDAAALEHLLADDLIHIHSSGQTHDKRQFIAHVGRMGGFVSIERGDLTLRAEGEMAVILGPTINTVRRLDSGAIARLEGFGTVLLERAPSGWRVVLSQMTTYHKA